MYVRIYTLYLPIENKQGLMKNQIIYKGMLIIEGTNGYFTAYPAVHSSFNAKDFKTLNGAKRYLDKELLKDY